MNIKKYTMFKLSNTLPNAFRILSKSQKRFASTISSPNDPKLINLLTRLEKFNNESNIFNKLDDLYLLSQRKGFFNLNSNNLEFLSNNNKINTNYNNLYNFNNLNKLVSNQYSNILLLPNENSAKINLPIQQTNPFKVSNPDSSNNSNITIINSIPGLNAFSGNSLQYSRNSPVDKYLKLLHGLAKNDVELKNRIELVLKAFDNEDDFFFNYVLEFWISGKSFNKRKAKKQQEKLGDNGQVLAI